MQILCLVTTDLTYDQRMMRICGSLASVEKWEVCLIGRDIQDSRPLQSKKYQQKRLSCFFEKGKWFYLEYNIRLFWLLLFTKVDVINAVDLDTLLPAWIVARLRGKKLVYDAHEYFTEVPEVVDRPAIKRIWEALASFLIPRVDRAYTVGEALAKEMTQRYQISFDVIRNVPLRQKPFHQVEKVDPPVILYQGALNAGRGLEVAIRAMSHLPQAQLWLAGEGDLSTSLRLLVSELQIQDRVRFLGYVVPDELKKITPKATIGLNLLEHRGKSYYFSLANKAFDYIQAGVPAIHPDFPEYQKLNKPLPVSLLLSEWTISAYLMLVTNLLNQASFYNLLVVNCQERAAQLVWEEEEQKLLALYQPFDAPA